MEAKRRAFQNSLYEKIRGNERMIEMLNKSIDSIESTMSADKDRTYFDQRIKRSEASIARYREENAQLGGKLVGVMSGACDAEINKMYQDTKDEILEKKKEVEKREAAIAVKEGKNHARGKAFDDKERKEMRGEFFARRDIERELARFLEISENLPEYISRNLKTMPNNKGYKFRGITFYGEMPPEPGPSVVFEKKPDGMLITEYYADQHITYFKPRDGSRKELVKRLNVTKNACAPSTKVLA